MALESEVLIRIKAVMDEFTKGFKQGMAEAQAASAATAKTIERDFSGLQKTMKLTGAGMTALGGAMSATVTPAVIAFGKQSVAEFNESERAVRQVESAMKSMGGVSGKTIDQLKGLADSIQMNSLYDDEAVLTDVIEKLLTFGNVAGETFDQAAQAAVDMSARFDQSLKASAIQLGKALQDPIKGVGALSRVGVQFTQQQKDQIEELVKNNDLLGAQAIILGELKKQTEGAAAAKVGGGGETAGLEESARKFNVAMGELRESLGGIIADFITPFIQKLAEVAQWLNNLSPQGKEMVVWIGGIVAVAGPLLAILGPIVMAFSALAPVIGALASPVGLVIAAIAGISVVLNEFGITFEQQWNAVVAVFNGVVEQFKLGVQLLTQLFTGDLSGALETLRQMWTNFWGTWKAVLDELFPGMIEAIIAFFENIITNVSEYMTRVKEFWVNAWTEISAFFITKKDEIVAAFVELKDAAIAAVSAMVTAIGSWIQEKLQAIWATAVSGIEWVESKFAWLQNNVTGNSYIPDMVDQIGQHMQRLDIEMVKPAEKATNAVADLFSSLADTVKGYISEFIKTGKFDIDRFIADISGKLINWGLDMLLKSLLGGLGGGGLLGGLFAKGGIPPLNKPSIVGENGPELFVPKQRGRVYSNADTQDMMSGNGRRTVPSPANNNWTVNVYARDADSFNNTETSLGRKMRRMAENGQRGS